MNFELPKYISDPKNNSAIGIVRVLIDQILLQQKVGVSLKNIYIRLYELGYIKIKEKSFLNLVKKVSATNSKLNSSFSLFSFN